MKATFQAALLCLFTFVIAEAQSLPMMQSPKQRVAYRYLLKEMVYAAVTKAAK